MWTGASWREHPSGAWLVGILAMVTPLKTWQGPFNIRAEGLEAETSQKSTFLREWGQRLEMTPVDLGNKSVKKLGVYQVLRLEVKPCHWDWVRHNRERRYFQERPGFSQVQGKKQNTFLRVSHNGDRQKIRKKKKKKKRQDADFPSSNPIRGKVYVVLLWATTSPLILQQQGDGGKYTERK